MTAQEIMDEMQKMDNSERIKLLELIYEKHFDTGITPEQRSEEIRVLEAYYNGELVEIEGY